MPEADPKHIRLSLPAEVDMRPVAEVAVSVIARRMGLPDGEVAAARTATGDAFAELVDTGDREPIDVDLTLEARRMLVLLRRGGAERSVTAPASTDHSG